MRARALIALLLLPLLADVAGAQVRNPFGRGRRRVAELPPMAPEIGRDMAYRRMPYSAETYPMVTRFMSPGITNWKGSPAWTTFGTGTRMDYRLRHFASVTLDLTSSFLGGPVHMETAEAGFRFGPGRADAHRVYPFFDVRAGYAFAISKQYSFDGLSQSPGIDAHYMQGFGGLAGTGMEVGLTRSLSLITAAAYLRMRMTSSQFGTAPPTPTKPYPLTGYRGVVGLRWNPVRLVRATGGDVR